MKKLQKMKQIYNIIEKICFYGTCMNFVILYIMAFVVEQESWEILHIISIFSIIELIKWAFKKRLQFEINQYRKELKNA